MKPGFFVLSFCMLLICSCNTSSKYEKLYIETTIATGDGESQVTKRTISEVTSDYFEVSLSSSGDTYLATKDIVEPKVGEVFKTEFFYIVDKDTSSIRFKDSTEFLNFMSARGYEMVDQIPNRYGADYTFKRKK